MNESSHMAPAVVRSMEWRIAQRCGLAEGQWGELLAIAEAAGSNALDLAIGQGLIAEMRFLDALAELLGVVVTVRPPSPSIRTDAAEAWAMHRYLAESTKQDNLRVLCPTGAIAVLLLHQKAENRLPPIVLTTRQAMLDALLSVSGSTIAKNAARTLPARYSARGPLDQETGGWRYLPAGLGMVLVLLVSTVFPQTAVAAIPLFLTPIFIIAALGVLTASLESRRIHKKPPSLPSGQLPRYSILVPLYREGNIVETLLARMRDLDYPRDRVELFLLVEKEDFETQAALRSTEKDAWMLVFPVPAGEPRTKPRALNAALPFASGDLLVVYDAEDAPDPDQLRRAAELFAASPGDTACAQARLAISNPRDNPLTYRFALDYAALFDCVKAGSARAGWAVPLGGSSNHFRADVLRRVGAWDAWNVTEDADLGIRLARFGWQVADLPSTTWEEAPNTLPGWMNQRTRWMKGWMQTITVHARAPKQMLAQLGHFRAMLISCTGLAVLLGALLYPFFALAVLLRMLNPLPLGAGSPFLLVADSFLILALVIAILVEIIPAMIALRHRHATFLIPWIAVAPIWYVMMSFAAWRAGIELFRRPFHWHKTTHGSARRHGGLAGVLLDRPPDEE